MLRVQLAQKPRDQLYQSLVSEIGEELLRWAFWLVYSLVVDPTESQGEQEPLMLNFSRAVSAFMSSLDVTRCWILKVRLHWERRGTPVGHPPPP